MLSGLGIELIEAQERFPLGDSEVVQWHRRHNGATLLAHGATATLQIDESVWYRDLEFNGTTVTRRFMNRFQLHIVPFSSRMRWPADRLPQSYQTPSVGLEEIGMVNGWYRSR